MPSSSARISEGASNIRHRVVSKGLYHLAGLVRGLQLLLRALVEVKVLLVNNHVHVRLLAQLAQLQRSELHLRGTAPPKHVHSLDRVLLQPLINIFGDLGYQHVLGMLGKHASHVEGDVANTDDRDLFGLKRPLARVIRIAVIPGHKICGTIGLRQIHAGNIQRAIAVRTGSHDHRVVVFLQVLHGYVLANVDVGEHANVSPLQNPEQSQDDLLDARVVRSHPVANQPVGGGKAFKQVDLYV